MTEHKIFNQAIFELPDCFIYDHQQHHSLRELVGTVNTEILYYHLGTSKRITDPERFKLCQEYVRKYSVRVK